MQDVKRTLVLFDFDGTITIKDSLPHFIRYAVPAQKFYTTLALLSPQLVLFFLGLMSGEKMKEKILSGFFRGMKEWQLNETGKKFVDYMFNNNFFRDKMLERIKNYDRGSHEICIVSASPCIYMKPVADYFGANIISTELEFINGIFSGRLKSPNCNGIQKAIRIKDKYDLSRFNKIIAFGNSVGDNEMLGLADEKNYISEN